MTTDDEEIRKLAERLRDEAKEQLKQAKELLKAANSLLLPVRWHTDDSLCKAVLCIADILAKNLEPQQHDLNQLKADIELLRSLLHEEEGE